MKLTTIYTVILTIIATVQLTAQGSWSSQDSGFGNGTSINSIQFLDEQKGWAVGDNVVLHTIDGGNNWIEQQSDVIDSDTYLESVYFTNELEGWVVGRIWTDFFSFDGIILNTMDGGETWSIQHISTGKQLNSVCFTDPLNGWAVGEGNTSSWEPIILHTNDGGLSWSEQSSGINTNTSAGWLQSVFFIDSNKGWAVGYGGAVTYTTDGGQNWTAQLLPDTDNLYSVFFLNENHGWAVGFGGFMSTVDGGVNWNILQTPELGLGRSVHFTDQMNGWVVGLVGSILRTTDGGNNWTQYTSGVTHNLEAVYFTNQFTGWASGRNGTILHFTEEDFTSIEEVVGSEKIAVNYPNPFTHTTTFEFSLNQSEMVLLEIYDFLGTRIQTLINGRLGANSHRYTFDGEALPAGAYFYRLQVGDHVESGKLILSK